MAEKQIYHVRMEQGASIWVLLIGMPVIFGGFLWFALKRIDAPDPVPYVLDFRAESVPVSVDFETRYEHIVVTAKRPEGTEIRFYDPSSGNLVGTYWEPPSAAEPTATN